MLLSEAFKGYAQDVIVFRNQSKKTEENHYVVMKALLIFFGDVPIESLSFPMIRDFKLELEKKRSAETVRNYIVRLRVVLQHMQNIGVACISPDRIPVPKRGDKVPTFITKEEVAQLIGAVYMPVNGYPYLNRLRNRLIISLLYASGIRVNELINLNILDIRDDNTFTIIGKGHKARLCFIDERTRYFFDDYVANRKDANPALLIADQTGKRITAGGVQFVFRLARNKAGINKPVHPHTLRHSFATNLLQNNGNVRHVQTMLGHSSLETTQMYLHVTNIDLQKAYNDHHSV